MELRHLRYFVAVAEVLNFRKAASALNISQPPLSVQIKDLEWELGTELFSREKNRVNLTLAGETFLIRAKSILADASKAKAEANFAALGKCGTIKIEFISSAVTGCLQSIVTKFKRSFPFVEVQLSQSTVRKILEDLKTERVDVGFVRGPVALAPHFSSIMALKESYYVALPSSHDLVKKNSISVHDLRSEKLVIYPRDTAPGSFDDILSIFAKRKIVPEIVQEATEQLTLAGLVASGMGYSIVPECMTRIKIPGVTHRPLSGGQNRTEIRVVAKKQCNSIVRNFLCSI